MVSSFTDLTATCFPSYSDNRSVLQVSTPKGVYNDKQTQELYRQVRDRVGEEFLVVVVPEDVKLEIIV